MKACILGETKRRRKFVLPDFQTRLEKQLAAGGAKAIKCLEPRSGLCLISYKHMPFYFIETVYRWMKLFFRGMRADCDFFLSGWPSHADLPIVWLLSKLKRKPFFFSPHYSEYEALVNDRGIAKKGSLKAGIIRFVDWMAVKLPDYIICMEPSHARLFAEEYGLPESKFLVTRQGYYGKFRLPKARQRKETIFLYIGSFIPHHGLEFLVKGFAKAKAKNSKLRLVGGGQEMEKIIGLAKGLGLENVEFPGYVGMPGLAQELADADVVLGVFGGKKRTKINFQNKLWEAIAEGKPLITAETIATESVGLRDKENALLCKAADIASIAEAIEWATKNKEKTREIGRKGQQLFTEKYSTKRLGKELARQIREKLRPSTRICLMGYNKFDYSGLPNAFTHMEAQLGAAGAKLTKCYVERSRLCFFAYRHLPFYLVETLARWALLLAKSVFVKCDALASGWPDYIDVPIVWLAAKLKGKPFFYYLDYSEYDTIVNDRGIVKPGTLKAKLLNGLDWLSLRLPDYFILSVVLPEPVEKEFGIAKKKFIFTQSGHDKEMRLPKPRKHKGTRFVYVGSFIPHHGLEHLLEAAAKLKGKNFELRLIGAGQEQRKIKSLAKKLGLKNAFFPGFIGMPGLAQELADADVVLGVFGGKKRTKINVQCKIWQALSAGKPIITCETDATKVIGLRDKKNSLLCKATDSGSLAKAMEWVMGNPGKAKELGKKAKELYEKNYSNKALGKRMLKEMNAKIREWKKG